MNKITITAGKQRNSIDVDRGSSTANVNITKDLSAHYSEVARDWATKMGGMVNNEDYSSKYYANQSKNHSDIAQENKEMAQEYSANAEQKYNETVAKFEEISTATEQAKAEIEEVTEQEKAELEQKGQEVKQDIQDDIKSQVDYVNDNLATIDEKLNKVTNTVLSHNMFDVVQKDHILTFAESKGLVAFGDYAYKTGSAGTRYGYPEFYDKCLKEYNEAKDYQMPYATKLVFNGNVVCRDTRIGEGKEGQIYLTNFSTENYASFNTYYGLPFAEPKNENYYLKYTMSFRTGDNISTQQCLFGWQYGIYLGINASKLHFYASSNGTSWNIASSKVGVITLLPNTEYKISLVNTNGHYMVFLTGNGVYSNTEIDIQNPTQINTNYAQNMTLGLWSFNGALQYPFLGNIIISDASYRNPVTGLYEFNDNGTGFYYEYSPDTVNDFDTVHYYYPLLTTPVKYHNNKHVYYNPIENIDRNYGHPIDYLYNQTGMAWLYGIDTTNERVRMPRNDKYFMCGTDAGEMVNAGLPNIEGTFLNGHYTVSGTGAFYAAGAGGTKEYGSEKNDKRVGFDASLSNQIYGNSDTVQTDAVKLIGYICVGNTETEIASTEVTEVTTTENDTVPLFTGMYFDFKPNNISWLAKDTTQAKSGKIYETTYNELVKCLNDVDNKYNIKVIDVADMVEGVDYSLYWKVDQVNMTFTTPSAISSKCYKDVASVVGNGMALGMTDGLEYFGASKTSSAGNLAIRPESYGVNVGTANTDVAQASTLSVGITTDPTKSGIVAHLEENTEAYLYFKVGNAVANKELIDVGTLTEIVNNKIDINSGYVDGQPEVKFALLVSTTGTQTKYKMDLSEYLPKDEYDYMVKFKLYGYDNDSTYTYYLDTDKWITLATPNTTASELTDAVHIHGGEYSRQNIVIIDLPVGSERYVALTGSGADNIVVMALGYRRLGKNQ